MRRIILIGLALALFSSSYAIEPDNTDTEIETVCYTTINGVVCFQEYYEEEDLVQELDFKRNESCGGAYTYTKDFKCTEE